MQVLFIKHLKELKNGFLLCVCFFKEISSKSNKICFFFIFLFGLNSEPPGKKLAFYSFFNLVNIFLVVKKWSLRKISTQSRKQCQKKICGIILLWILPPQPKQFFEYENFTGFQTRVVPNILLLCKIQFSLILLYK